MVSVQYHGKDAVVSVGTDLASRQAGDQLKAALLEACARGMTTVTMDLGKVRVLDSYAIGKILLAYKRLKENGGQLCVRSLTPEVREMLDALLIMRLLKERLI